jgi:hypothetical protein
MAENEVAMRLAKILFDLADEVTERFNRPEVAELIEPAIVIFVDEDPPDIQVIERIRLIAAFSGESYIDKATPTRNHPIQVFVSSSEGTAHYGIPDPRVFPDWLNHSL